MMPRRGLTGSSADRSDRKPGGGCFPSARPHYPASVARALHELAERRPPWPEFIRERARILHYDRKTSERLEQR